MTQYEQKFRDILAEILQLDQAELDFGIYRIMNQKRKDIEAFLNNRLVPEVTKILKAQTAAGTDISAMENEVFSHLAKFFISSPPLLTKHTKIRKIKLLKTDSFK